jgi:hypothetical protein
MRHSRKQAALSFWDSHLWWQDCGCPLDLLFEQVSCCSSCCTASVELGGGCNRHAIVILPSLPFLFSNHCNHHVQLIALQVAGPCRCVLQVLRSRAALVDPWSDALPGTTSCWDHLCCAAVGCISREQLVADSAILSTALQDCAVFCSLLQQHHDTFQQNVHVVLLCTTDTQALGEHSMSHRSAQCGCCTQHDATHNATYITFLELTLQCLGCCTMVPLYLLLSMVIFNTTSCTHLS